MITTVLLIAPLNVNFATQLQVTKHGTTICHNIYQALSDSLEKTISMMSLAINDSHWSGQYGTTQM